MCVCVGGGGVLNLLYHGYSWYGNLITSKDLFVSVYITDPDSVFRTPSIMFCQSIIVIITNWGKYLFNTSTHLFTMPLGYVVVSYSVNSL